MKKTTTRISWQMQIKLASAMPPLPDSTTTVRINVINAITCQQTKLYVNILVRQRCHSPSIRVVCQSISSIQPNQPNKWTTFRATFRWTYGPNFFRQKLFKITFYFILFYFSLYFILWLSCTTVTCAWLRLTAFNKEIGWWWWWWWPMTQPIIPNPYATVPHIHRTKIGLPKNDAPNNAKRIYLSIIDTKLHICTTYIFRRAVISDPWPNTTHSKQQFRTHSRPNPNQPNSRVNPTCGQLFVPHSPLHRNIWRECSSLCVRPLSPQLQGIVCDNVTGG